jgi:uncharacterized protein (DUF2267 family)
MTEDEFFADVRRLGGLESPEDTERAVRATLAVLGTRLPTHLLGPLGRLLPGDLGELLHTLRSGRSGAVQPVGWPRDSPELWAAADTAARIDLAEAQANGTRSVAEPCC